MQSLIIDNLDIDDVITSVKELDTSMFLHFKDVTEEQTDSKNKSCNSMKKVKWV